MKYFDDNGLIYDLNNEMYTATIIKSDQALKIVKIPRSIIYESQEYVITTICQYSFAFHKNIQVVTFSDDSKVELIENEAFTNSSLLSILFPPSVTKIGKRSFYSCEELFMVKFTEDSKLKIIDSEAFLCCGFKSFFLPSNVIEIGENSFNSCSNLLLFSIPENSKLTTIKKKAFAWTPIISLYFPQNLQNLGEEWSCSMTCLRAIKISPYNKIFKSICDDNSMIVGKSDPNSDLYDSLVFVTRQIKFLKIPSFIKYINTTAVSGCEQIEFVEFEKESSLISIEKGAFSHSSLVMIKFPASLIHIKDNAFARCENLNKVDFENNSQIKSIGKHAFAFTFVNSFCFPEFIYDFEKEWCYYLSCLCHISLSPKNKNLSYFDSKMIIGKSNPNEDIYDTLILARRDIDQIKIPSFIKVIKSCAFFDCIYLRKVEFDEDSKLELIESYAFCGSALIEFTVPKHVKIIEKNAFDRCKLLYSIKFHEDSELIKIGKFALSSDSLTSISIPKSVKIMKEGFNTMSRILTNISISPENKNFKIYNENMVIGKSNPNIDSFDDLLFVNGDINYIKIPSFIKRISNFTFNYLISLEKIDFEENSKLEEIDFAAFGSTSIKNVIFPASVKIIGRFAFENCFNLTYIEFLGDNIVIDSTSFYKSSKIRVISFPNATKIKIAYDTFKDQYCNIFICTYGEIIQFPSKYR